VHIVCTKYSFSYFKSAQSMHVLQVKCAHSLHKVFIYLVQVCTKYAFAHHKVCIKCARCRLCRLCRLGAHSTHHGFLGWSMDWGQYTDDGPLARAYVEEPAASAWPPVIVDFILAERVASPAPAGPPASKRACRGAPGCQALRPQARLRVRLGPSESE